MSRQRSLEWYVLAVVLVGAALAASAFATASVWVSLVYLGVFAASELTASRLRDDMSVSLGNIVVLVALLDQGWQTAVICALGTLLVDGFRTTDQRWLKLGFNAGQYAVAAGAAGLVYELLAAGATFPANRAMGAALLAGAVFVLLNATLVWTVVAIAAGESPSTLARELGAILLMQVPYTGIAFLAAALLRAGSVGPLLLVLLFLPVFIARSGLAGFQRVEEAYDRLVRSFVTAIEVKDLYTRGHSERVAQLSVHVAEELGIPYQERRLTSYAALLHDVGKIGVPLCVLNKPGPLDDDEFAQIKRHPTIGAEILRDIDFLEPVLDIVRFHHERLDGRGYPHGIDESELNDLVRIVTAVDAFDAMTSTRSYRRALTVGEAVAELRRCVDAQFDRRMVEALAQVVERLDWQPTVEFPSDEVDTPPPLPEGATIPRGAAIDRLEADDAGRGRGADAAADDDGGGP